MQSVDLPLLDTGPSDAMSSLVTAVIEIDTTYQKSQYILNGKNDKIFPLDFVCSGVYICHRNTAFFKLFCLIHLMDLTV